MMRCGVRRKAKVRRQEIVEKEIQCFRCRGIVHYKWKYPNIEVEKQRRKNKEVMHYGGAK